ncbi:MAG: hypothetical protein NVS2B3_10610 [Vulcanimicrobiaceae bacterium]
MAVVAPAATGSSGAPTPAVALPALPAAALESVARAESLDEAESPDTVATLAEQLSRRATMVLLRQQSAQTDLQLRLDRMRAEFNAAQEMRSEQLREMNALRDMAVEQGKKDDEILKKFIAMI